MRIYVSDRETGTFMEKCSCIEEAKSLILWYESADYENGIYEENFYDIVNENHESLLY